MSIVVIVVSLIIIVIVLIIMIVSCIYCPGCYVKLACIPIKVLKMIIKLAPKPKRK